MQYEAYLIVKEKKEEELYQEIKEKRQLVEKYEEQITEEKIKYGALMERRENEEGKLHKEIRGLKRQLVEKEATPEKEMDTTSESGYECTGQLLRSSTRSARMRRLQRSPYPPAGDACEY